MLKVNNITFRYPKGKAAVLSDFSLEIDFGGVYGLLGSNGAGKSTLLYLISGLLTPQGGCVEFNGEDTRRRLPGVMNEIMLVPEEFDLPQLRLHEYAKLNGAFYPRFSHAEMMENLGIFELDSDQRIGSLSMGQKKKVALSFALACNTKLVLLDEPTNGLDIPGKSAFRRVISRSASDERIFVISTHQVRDVSQILDHVVIIDNTRVLLDRSVADIQSNLKFINTSDPELIGSALFAQKGIGGAGIILPNSDGNDSELDLELLFNFAHEDPEKLNSLFTAKSEKI